MVRFSECEQRTIFFIISNRSIFIIKIIRWILVLLLSFVALTGNSITYYISNSGDDSNPGTSEELPWKTLSKVNNFFRLEPGDQILFKRGDEWVGTLNVNTSGTSGNPIVYGAYGSGEKPKIYGSEVITGWTLHSGNIYKAKLTTDINQLFIGGKRVQNARYPKEGYLYIDKVNSTSSVTCNDLNGGINYSGAKMHTRTVQWRLISSDIVSSSSTSLMVKSSPSYGFSEGKAFFLNNHIEFLTHPGEWHYDEATRTVYLWTPQGDTPANYEVRGSVVDNCVYIENKDHITLKDLTLEQSKGNALHSDASNYLTIDKLIVNNPGWVGFYVTNSRNLKVSNNYIRGAMSDGMYLSNEKIDWAGESIEIIDNEIRDVAVFDEIGIDGLGLCNGIFVRIKNAVVKYNKVINNGYNGIQFYGQNSLIENNLLDGYCETLNDGGGIYTWVGISGGVPLSVNSSGSKVNSNIIINGNGDGTGYTKKYNGTSGVSGIYADLASTGIFIEDNTIIRSNGWGILYNKTVDVISINNTLFDNPKGFRLNYEKGITGINKFEKNIIYQLDTTNDNGSPPIMIALSSPGSASMLLDSNLYVNRAYENILSNLDDYSKMNFLDWQTFTGVDSNSSFVKVRLANDESEQLFYNDTKQTKIFNLGSDVFKDIYGNEITGKFKLEPFTSIILIGKNFSNINQKPEISDHSFNINSPVFRNDTIGKFTAIDPDSEQILHYSIIHGDETGLFSIDSTSGVIFCNEDFQTSFNQFLNFFVQVSDNAVNSLSDTAIVTVFIEGKDITPPVITSFNIPSVALDFTIPVIFFSAIDDIGVTGFKLTETSLIPKITDDEWMTEPPGEYTFSGEGTYTIYAWVKDSAGNISNPAVDMITVLIPDFSPTFSEYLFEEDSGTNIFDSKGSNDGLIFNDAIRVAGANGLGLMFANSGFINLGQCFGENVRNELSLSTWIKPDSTNSGSMGIIMHGGPNTVTYGLYLNSKTKAIDFKTSGTSADSLVIGDVDKLWDGNWHHLVAVYNGEEKIIYLDNDVIATIQTTGTIDLGYGYNLLIGAGRDEPIPTHLYEGLLDEVRIYNYGITSAEVGELFHPVNRELNKISTVEDIIICEGEEYLGLTQPGKYKRVLQRISPSASGADSIVVTNLYVNPVYNVFEDVIISFGENYKGWIESGTYQMTLSSYQGCDSIVMTNLIVEGGKTHYVELEKGWNIFSTYIIPDNKNMEVVMNELCLSSNLVMVQDESDNTYEEWNSTGSWTNNIGDLKKTEGYKILVNSSSILEIHGREIELPIEIDLEKGVNIITFPFDKQVDAIQIFQTLIDQGILEKVQDESGNSLEYWNSIGWLNGIGNLNVGKGYLVHVSNNGNLKINNITEKSNHIFTANSKPVYFNVDYSGNGFAHMNINITGLKESGLDVGDEIAVYDEMYCVGAIQLNELHFKMNAVSIPASGSDKIMRIGFYDGNPIDFRIWRKQKNETVSFTPDVIEGELKFSKYSSLFVTLKNFANISENIKVYPNPANSVVIIEIPILPEQGVKIFLLDATGKEIISKIVYINSEKLNVENLPAGFYVLKTYIKDKLLTHKIIVY